MQFQNLQDKLKGGDVMRALLKKIEIIKKQSDDYKLLQGYLGIIEGHIMNSMTTNSELHSMKFNKLKMGIMKDLRGFKNNCRIVR
jgi:hypothetical protein